MFGRTGWICNKCNNFNFESRNKCNRCYCNKDPKTIEEINKKKEEREKKKIQKKQILKYLIKKFLLANLNMKE